MEAARGRERRDQRPVLDVACPNAAFRQGIMNPAPHVCGGRYSQWSELAEEARLAIAKRAAERLIERAGSDSERYCGRRGREVRPRTSRAGDLYGRADDYIERGQWAG